MAPAAINDHHDLCAGIAKDAHDLMDILAQFLGIKMRHDLIEDARGTLLDGPQDVEQDAAGDAAPRATVPPALAFERFFPLDLPMAQWTEGKTGALSLTPPASSGQGKAPYDRFIFIQ
jgi:hypothetical protein